MYYKYIIKFRAFICVILYIFEIYGKRDFQSFTKCYLVTFRDDVEKGSMGGFCLNSLITTSPPSAY